MSVGATTAALDLLALFSHLGVHLGTSAVGVEADEGGVVLLLAEGWIVVDGARSLLATELGFVQHHQLRGCNLGRIVNFEVVVWLVGAWTREL